MSENAHTLEKQIAELLQTKLGEIVVMRLIRLSGGANRETWSFEAIEPSKKKHSLILQMDRPGMERLEGTCAREAQILTIAGENGVPVPKDKSYWD